MTETVYIEPAHEHRPAFAAWGLRQSPALQTASAQGWDVPLDLYPSIPSELLAGAFVDGYRYNVPTVQPVAAPAPKKTTSRKPRKRAAKRAAPKVDVSPPVIRNGATVPVWAAELMDADVAAAAASEARQDAERRHHLVEFAGAELPRTLVERVTDNRDGDTPGWGADA